MFHPPAGTVNHHLLRGGEFSTGRMGRFQPELTSRDFDGLFEWTPRASRPKMGVAPLTMNQRSNFKVGADQEIVYVVNDNDRRLFDFEKVAL
jgi:hypothetical protein